MKGEQMVRFFHILTFAVAMANVQGSARDYSVLSRGDHAEISSTKFGYRLRAPNRWHVSEGNPNPYMFSFAPSDLSKAQDSIPAGGAEVVLMADETTYAVGSVDRWVKADASRGGVASLTKVDSTLNPSIAHAVQMVSYEDEGDRSKEVVVHRSTVYFEFNGHPFALSLRFEANNPRAREYERVLLEVLRSFHKLDGQ